MAGLNKFLYNSKTVNKNGKLFLEVKPTKLLIALLFVKLLPLVIIKRIAR